MRVFGHKFGHLAFRRLGADIQGMFDKNPRGGLPSMANGEFDAIFPRNLQRLQAGRAQILVQNADRCRADHVAWTGDRKGGNRQAAGQRLQQHQAKRVGLAGKYENIGGRVDFGQFLAVPGAQEHGIRIFPLQRRQGRPIADDELGAGQIEVEEGFEIFSTATRPTLRNTGIGRQRSALRG